MEAGAGGGDGGEPPQRDAMLSDIKSGNAFGALRHGPSGEVGAWGGAGCPFVRLNS